MNKKAAVQMFIPFILIAFLAISIVVFLRPTVDIQIDPFFSRPLSSTNTVDSNAAAELSAYRWQAMANFFAENDLLNGSALNSAGSNAAAELSAYRWQAMANFFAENDLLNGSALNSAGSNAAAELSAYRWRAMANFYAENDLLNGSALTPQARTAAVESVSFIGIDPVDVKLFNTVYRAAQTTPENKSRILYARNPVDLKLFNSAVSAGE